MDTYRGEFEEPFSLNLYNYCSGNSINYVDPNGHHAVWLFAAGFVSGIGHVGMTAAEKKNVWHYLSYNNKYKKDKTTTWDTVSTIKRVNENYRKGLSDYTSGIKFFGKLKKTINVFTKRQRNHMIYGHIIVHNLFVNLCNRGLLRRKKARLTIRLVRKYKKSLRSLLSLVIQGLQIAR